MKFLMAVLMITCLAACASKSTNYTRVSSSERYPADNNGRPPGPGGPGGVDLPPQCDEISRQVYEYDRRLRFAEAALRSLRAEASINYDVMTKREKPDQSQQAICGEMFANSSLMKNTMDLAIRECEAQANSAPAGGGYGPPQSRGDYRGGPGTGFGQAIRIRCQVFNNPSVSAVDLAPQNMSASGESRAKWKDYSTKKRSVDDICAPAYAAAEREVQTRCMSSFGSYCPLRARTTPSMNKNGKVFGDDEVVCSVRVEGMVPAGDWFTCRATATAVARPY